MRRRGKVLIIRTILPTVISRTCPPPELVHFFGSISVKQGVVIHPEHAFAVDLPKVVKIKLPDQAVEPVVAEILRKRFRLETREIGDAKGFPRWQPLEVDSSHHRTE